MDISRVIEDRKDSDFYNSVESIADSLGLLPVNFEEITSLRQVYFIGAHTINKKPAVVIVNIDKITKSHTRNSKCYNLLGAAIIFPKHPYIDPKNENEYYALMEAMEGVPDLYMKITEAQISSRLIYRKRDIIDIKAQKHIIYSGHAFQPR